MTEYTSGEWLFDISTDNRYAGYIGVKGKGEICPVSFGEKISRAEAISNGYLMKAAPKLLKACMALVGAKTVDEHSEARAMMIEAIAEAKRHG